MPNQQNIRYAVLARLPRHTRELVEYIGAAGESAEQALKIADMRLRNACGGEHYCTLRPVALSTARRAYPRELRLYEEQQAWERLHAQAGVPNS